MKPHSLFRQALFVLALAALAAAAYAERVSTSAIEQDVTVADGVARATFRISVANDDESAAMTHVAVIFADGTSVSIGDIAAGKTAVSDPQTKTIDLSDHPSRHVPLKATLKYQRDGEEFESPAGLVILVEKE